MNIFWLDYDFERSVSYYCDQHVVKMITEYAQLLSTSSRLNGLEQGYKLSHVNHPCTIWLGESLDNWLALKQLSKFLYREFVKRFSNTHNSYFVIEKLEPPNLPNKGFTEPPQCMPFIYKSVDYVIAYRNYYIGDKKRFVRYRYSEQPRWLKEEDPYLDLF